MSVLKIRDEKTGAFIDIPTIRGKDGTIQYKAGKNIKIEDNTISAIIPDFETEIEAINNSLSKFALNSNSGAKINLTYDITTHNLTSSLLNANNEVLNQKSINLPLESMVVSGSYDNEHKKIIMTLQNGNTVEVAVGDLVSGLVGQETFDSAMQQIQEDLKIKFDTPYFFEYNSNGTDFETTDTTTLAMFNEIREAMEYGQHPCVIVKKGITGVNSQQTYHFIVPQFGSFESAYVMLKSSPVRKANGEFNVVALNCERSAETGKIIRIYENKEDSTVKLGDDKIFIISATSTDNEKVEIMQKVYDLWKNGIMANLTYVVDGLVFEMYDVDKYNTHIDFYVKNGGLGSTRYGITYHSFDRYKIKCYYSDDIITSVEIEELSDVFMLANDAEILGMNNTIPFTPEHDYQPTTKQYVDNRIFTINLVRNEIAGLDADKTYTEIQKAITDNKTIVCILESHMYYLCSSSNGDLTFCNVTGSVATLLIYQDETWTQQTIFLFTDKGGQMSGDINMNGYGIRNIQELHIDGAAPLYFGSTIRTGETTASRITGIAGGGAALVKANTQAEYAPFYVGTPTSPDHCATKGYVDSRITQSQLSQYPLYYAEVDGTVDNWCNSDTLLPILKEAYSGGYKDIMVKTIDNARFMTCHGVDLQMLTQTSNANLKFVNLQYLTGSTVNKTRMYYGYAYAEGVQLNSHGEVVITGNCGMLPSGTNYVDLMEKDGLKQISGYDSSKTQVLKNVNGEIKWINE